MVARLQSGVIFIQSRVIQSPHAGLYFKQLLESLRLQLVTHPTGNIFSPRPTTRSGTARATAPRLVFPHHLTRGQEFKIRHREYILGQRPHEFEDTRFRRLVFTERLVVHKEVHDLAVLRAIIQPADIFVRGNRPLAPLPLAKTHREVVAQPGILQQ